MFNNGTSKEELENLFGATRSTVNKIISRRSYPNLKETKIIAKEYFRTLLDNMN